MVKEVIKMGHFQVTSMSDSFEFLPTRNAVLSFSMNGCHLCGNFFVSDIPSVTMGSFKTGVMVFNDRSIEVIKTLCSSSPSGLGLELKQVNVTFYQTGIAMISFLYDVLEGYENLSRSRKAQKTHDVHNEHEIAPTITLNLTQMLLKSGYLEARSQFQFDCFCLEKLDEKFSAIFSQDNSQKKWTHTSFFIFVDYCKEKLVSGENEIGFSIDRHVFGEEEIAIEFNQFITGESAGEWYVSGLCEHRDAFYKVVNHLSIIFLMPMQIRAILDSLRINSSRLMKETKSGNWSGSTSILIEYIATSLLRVSHIKSIFNSIAAPYRKIFLVSLGLFGVAQAESDGRDRAGDVQVFVDAQNIEAREKIGNVISISAIALSMISALSSIIAVFGFVGSNFLVFPPDIRVIIACSASAVCLTAFLIVWRLTKK